MGGAGELSRLIRHAANHAAEDEVRAMHEAASRLFGPGEPPMRVGRYVLLELLGSGGAGLVYSAYDPRLDRRVALKLILPMGSRTQLKGKMLLREAQAIAQVSHPNVVAVYDAGTVDVDGVAQVFLAMEQVEGVTLAQWLRERDRHWRKVVEIFVGAGRGLAAAHRAGILHRDFKPRNVIVDDDGRARVIDFGLARLADGDSERGDRTPFAVEPQPAALGSPLTETGTVMGTPGYMAPEQHAGEPATPACDQFSFCTALYEALCGRRPFVATTSEQLRSEFERGPPTPTRDRMPPHVWRVVRRGLSREPAARFAGMEPLLEQLSRDPTRRRRVLVAATLTAGLGGGLFALLTPGPVDCAGEPQLVGVWDAQRRAAIEAAFAATDKPYASDASAAVQSRLDAYVEQWLATNDAACGELRRGEEKHLPERRMECLRWRLEDVRAVTGLLATADATTVERAVDAIAGLRPVDSCASAERLRQEPAPPKDDAARAEVQAIRMHLAQARAHREAGKYAAAIEITEGMVPRARAVGYPPVLAETLERLGGLRQQAGDPEGAEADLVEAATIAGAAGHDRVSAGAWISLMYVVGYAQGRHDAGLAFGHAANAVLGRLDDPDLRAVLEYSWGTVEYLRGNFPAAREKWEAAVELRTQLFGPDDIRLANMLDSLGVVLQREGAYAESVRLHERVLGLKQAALGSDHPSVAATRLNLGTVLSTQGRLDEAEQMLRGALAIQRASLGGEHPAVALALTNLGYVAARRESYAQAREHFERALALYERAPGPQDREEGLALRGLGFVLTELGEPRAGRVHLLRALKIATELEAGQRSRARVLVDLARTDLALGQSERALVSLHEAVEIVEHSIEPPDAVAQVKFELAQALYRAGDDRSRARSLALEAKEGFARAESSAQQRAEVEAWLREHPSP